MEKNIFYQLGIMAFIRISSRLAVLYKWAELIPPRLVLLPASIFHEFAYAVGEQRVQVENLSSP